MLDLSQSSQWTRYPDIPIILDAQDEHRTATFFARPRRISYVPRVIPRSQSIRYITVTSPSQTRSRSQDRTTSETIRRQPRRPISTEGTWTTKYKEKRNLPWNTNPRFGGDSFSQNTPQSYPINEPALGLGIMNESFSSTSVLTTSSLAQRIEDRLWRCNSSGNVAERWSLEIISWIVSAVCMGAVLVILLYIKGKGIPNWPTSLALTVFFKISSAALLLPTSEALSQLKWSWIQNDSKMWDFEMFDLASRGPWGSLLLLFRTKCMKLAALGAAITLFSLALDPFFQQVANSTIPRVVQYSPNLRVLFTAGKKVAQNDIDLGAAATPFFYGNGTQPMAFGAGERAEFPISCPTSNCTWPPYKTLGFCSSCVEVSKLLEYACLTTRVDWIANLTGPGTESTWPNGTVCGYFLNATSTAPVLMSGEALIMRALPLVSNPIRKSFYGNGTIHFNHIRNRLADVVIASVTNGSASVYRNETPVAHECVVSYCVKTIVSSFVEANYKEDVIDTFQNTTAGPYPFSLKLQDQSVLLSYTENIVIKPLDSGETSDYGVSNFTAFTTLTAFDNIFPSFLTAETPSADAFLRFSIRPNGDPTSKLLEFNPWLPPNNVTRHMERLATALTNTIRSSSTNNQWLFGTASSKETYVEVRWLWLSLPLGVLFLCLVFLVATIIKSWKEKDHVGVWKTSALATLLYGLPDYLQSKITSVSTAGTPRAKAKELKIKMLPKKGWRSSEYPFSPTSPKIRQHQPPPGWI
ncbi:hypothetical protein K505DRAFT_409961 [Melanomma pulvis-pyrius CBS 109.77]|uniref:DUF3176 domain containing protein n=1 Tax=Melanomma pulvis-pyrius CBS 109.77 TaxID=1314802 RepID=A0A6A6X1D9_9PLEO|nr:hypothetical protein K505DRAFT_409961 [Melanomma pulvis-pyrius CBS 109.77]